MISYPTLSSAEKQSIYVTLPVNFLPILPMSEAEAEADETEWDVVGKKEKENTDGEMENSQPQAQVVVHEDVEEAGVGEDAGRDVVRVEPDDKVRSK